MGDRHKLNCAGEGTRSLSPFHRGINHRPRWESLRCFPFPPLERACLILGGGAGNSVTAPGLTCTITMMKKVVNDPAAPPFNIFREVAPVYSTSIKLKLRLPSHRPSPLSFPYKKFSNRFRRHSPPVAPIPPRRPVESWRKRMPKETFLSEGGQNISPPIPLPARGAFASAPFAVFPQPWVHSNYHLHRGHQHAGPSCSGSRKPLARACSRGRRYGSLALHHLPPSRRTLIEYWSPWLRALHQFAPVSDVTSASCVRVSSKQRQQLPASARGGQGCNNNEGIDQY